MAEITWKSILTKLVGGDHLSAEESEWFVDDLMNGNADPVAALHGQKTLPQFILVGVEGKTSYVIHRIADIRR